MSANFRGPEIVTEAEFERLQELFYRKTGITFGAAKRYFVDRRLIDRVVATGANSTADYLNQIERSDAHGRELQQLINTLTVNETYFYREEYQFKCLVNSLLPEVTASMLKSAPRPVRIWSLPCSTGEEPYSLALYLLENWREVDRYDIQITASDIDSQVIARAEAGLYDDRSVQYLSAAIKSRYFLSAGINRWQITDDLRSSVDFSLVNLNDRSAMQRHAGRFDVIFCRNLLIYFDDASRRLAAEYLFDALRPGGFVCLGHSESMSRMSSLFTVRKFLDAIVYQKPR